MLETEHNFKLLDMMESTFECLYVCVKNKQKSTHFIPSTLKRLNHIWIFEDTHKYLFYLFEENTFKCVYGCLKSKESSGYLAV